MACELCEKTAGRLEMFAATLNAVVCLLTEKNIIGFEELHEWKARCLAYMDQMAISTADELRENLEEAFRQLAEDKRGK